VKFEALVESMKLRYFQAQRKKYLLVELIPRAKRFEISRVIFHTTCGGLIA